MQTVIINKKEYPFAFVYSDFKKWSEITAKMKNELETLEVAYVMAINKGFKLNGLKEKIDRKELVDLLDLDMGAVVRLANAFTKDTDTLNQDIKGGPVKKGK